MYLLSTGEIVDFAVTAYHGLIISALFGPLVGVNKDEIDQSYRSIRPYGTYCVLVTTINDKLCNILSPE